MKVYPVGITYIYYHAKSGSCSFKIGGVMAILDFHHPYHHHHHQCHHHLIGIIYIYHHEKYGYCVYIYGSSSSSHAFHSKIEYALVNAYN